MERYVLTRYAEAPAGTRAVYDEFMRLCGAEEPPLWLASLGHNPRLVKAYWEKARVCLLEGELPRRFKELVALVVARENRAHYSEAYHAHAVLQLDPRLRLHDLDTVLDDHSTVELSIPQRLALRFAVRMARDAHSVTDDDFDALAQAGFAPALINELLGVIDFAMMFSCYTTGMRLPVEPWHANGQRGH